MTYQYPNAVIQIFCKAPVAGSVKTRLMPQLTAGQAVEVHKQLTQRTLELVCSAHLCPVQLWCAPSVDHPYFTKAADDYALNLLTQPAGDLGQRMAAALNTGIRQFGYVLLIGCDCPSLTRDDLASALSALSGNHNVVLAPAEDGGYSLIGIKQFQPELFKEINWGSSEVLAKTRIKINALKLLCYELKIQWDVDTYTDYLRFLETFGKAHIA
jgi:rSAM/selenodomain-associated transferase 1